MPLLSPAEYNNPAKNKVLKYLLDAIPKNVPNNLKPNAPIVWYYCQAFAKKILEQHNNTTALLTRSAFYSTDNNHALLTGPPPSAKEKPDQYEQWRQQNSKVITTPIR